MNKNAEIKKNRIIKFRAWDIDEEEIIYGIDKIKEKYDGIELIDELLNPQNAGIMEIKIMQFTGLKDKNKKEIYEGDIIDSHRYGIFEVEWRHDGFHPFNMPNNVPNENDCEVIGNIYENPELLRR